MLDRGIFDQLLRKYAKTQVIEDSGVLFGSGVNLSSIAFTEFIMDLEEECDLDIDIDGLDASIQTVGQLYNHLAAG